MADIERLCRLCLSPLASSSQKAYKIFEKGTKLPMRIMACCSLEIQTSDALPKQICRDCRYQLDKTYIFRTKAKNAEAKLKRHIRLLNAGKASHVLDEEEDVDEYEDSLAFVSEHENLESLSRSGELEKLQETISRLKESEAQLSLEVSRLQKMLESAQKTEKPVEEMEESVETEYYVEMLEEVVEEDKGKEAEEVKMAEQKGAEEAEEVVEHRYECEPEEYSAIEKAVRAHMANQPNSTVQTNFQLLIEKYQQNLTKVEIKTEDGNVLFMEFNTDSSSDGVGKVRPAETKLFSCEECNSEFSKFYQFKSHLSLHKSGSPRKGLDCNFCKCRFPNQSSLDRHLRTHTGEKPFKCAFEGCGKSFIQKETLKRHQLMHTGELPFKCKCSASFRLREQLKAHMLKTHTDNPEVKWRYCPLCPKFFRHPSGLSRHILQHTGTTHVCHVCLKSYSDRSALRRHMVGKHGEGKSGTASD